MAILSTNCSVKVAGEVTITKHRLTGLLDKNIMLFYGLVWQKHPSGPWIRSANTFTSALNSKLASELDAKIDDGRPGTGKFLASKGNLNEKYCYDKTYSDVDKAIYNKDDRLDFGCNILYVMEDVK